jgi:uncharacterized protein (DUF305 family)
MSINSNLSGRATRRAALLLAAAAVTVTLTACGESTSHSHTATGASTTATASTGDHNVSDVSFAQNMIAHHKEAIEMADLATTRAGSQQVKDLATTIKAEQSPEIATMTNWLTSWKQPTVATPDMSMHDMSGMGSTASASAMPGMMSSADMAALASTSGTAFDRQFLQMMITHHNGAVQMAKTEQATGQYPPAIALAGNIITSQTAEIAKMQSMLQAL